MWNKFLLDNLECYSTSKKYRFEELTLDHLRENKNESEEYRVYIQTYPHTARYTLKPEFDTLPSGIYKTIDISNTNYLLKYSIIPLTQIIQLTCVQPVINDFNTFQNSKKIYTSAGLKYKRGVLLYGPPGTGKTSTINTIISALNLEEAIVIITSDLLCDSFRLALEKDPRLKIIVLEELTEVLKYNSIGNMLNFLDGEESLENTFIIGTTNYPEKLPGNIVNRPGRFDRLYKLGYLDFTEKRAYAQKILDRQIRMEEIVALQETKDLTIAALKEILLIVLRDKVSLHDAIKIIEKQTKLVNKDFEDNKTKVGFLNEEDD